MDYIELYILDPQVSDLSNGKIEPTFQIYNGDTVYDCDPTPAVESAKLKFTGYETCKHLGYMKINVEDKDNVLADIIGFLHGDMLAIKTTNAFTITELSNALGIPYIALYSSNVARKSENTP